MCSEDTSGSAPAQNGAVAVASATGRANGSPPSGSVAPASQSHSSDARGLVTGATSSNTSKACIAPTGWLSTARRSGSSVPYPPSGLR